MKLGLEQIKATTCACAGVNEENGAIRFQRLPEELGAQYQNHEGARIRRACPASIRLRFHSNSRTLNAGFSYGAGARAIYQAACLVDDKVFPLGPSETADSWSGAIPPLKKRKERLFELWLPSMVRTDILFLELEDDSSFAPAKNHACRWLAYGDSITQGMTVHNPAENHIALLARKLSADVWNMGIGGAKMDAFLADTIPPFDYDIATVAYGVNDFNSDVPLASYKNNARAFLNALSSHRPSSPILAISPIPFLTDKQANVFGETLDEFRAALASASSGLPNAILVDGRELVPAEPGYFVDGCHPNAEGARMYAERLLPIMQSCLKR